MNIEYLRYLVVVAKHESISKAASQLHFKQQYLSQVIKSVEAEFEVVIFERHPKGITLTADGSYFLKYVKEVIATIDHLYLGYLYPSKLAQKSDIKEIHVYTVPYIQAPSFGKIIRQFQQRFPDVTVTFEEDAIEAIIQAVLADPLAMGIICTGDEINNFATQYADQLNILLGREDTLVALVGREDHASQNRPEISIAELMTEELVVYAPKGLPRSLCARILSPYGEPNFRYVVENTDLFFNLLNSGDYYSIGSYSLKSHPQIMTIPFKEKIILSSIVITNLQSTTSFTMKSFLSIFLMEYTQPVV